MVSFKQTKVGGSGSRGAAALKLAVDSFQNIANVQIDAPSNLSSSLQGPAGGFEAAPASGASIAATPDFEEIARKLRGGGPIGIGVLARQLHWEPLKAAEALALAGQSGLLQFSKSGDTTTVELAPEIASAAQSKNQGGA